MVDFEQVNGNVQGYATHEKTIAINPLAQLPNKTMFHELGHQLLGHCDGAQTSDGMTLPRNLKEVEAESVALICLEV